jgi:predicted Zn-dependent protease
MPDHVQADHASLRQKLSELSSRAGASYATLLIERSEREDLTLKNGALEPPALSLDQGLQVSVYHKGGAGYACTGELSEQGLTRAFEEALAWAEASAGQSAWDSAQAPQPHPQGSYASPVSRSWWSLSAAERLDWLRAIDEGAPTPEGIVHREVSVLADRRWRWWYTDQGGAVAQLTELLSPDLLVVASRGGVTQRRSFGLRGRSRQAGLEAFNIAELQGELARLIEEALTLTSAPLCEAGVTDVVIDPEQMMLQLHESIGHPLELDRILGDERNYAGRSFVSLDMFGSYQYGSPLLNVTFDPSVEGELASYAYDEQGARAVRRHLIKEGLLVRPLGGELSEVRARALGHEHIESVACTRVQRWNRPPIDRMANLNIEPGDQSLEQLIGGVERGLFMGTNLAWSIDDSRNKFQFGCEYGRVIENGELKGWVRSPNYRGVSAQFWRSLDGVGDASSWSALGTPYCGKGEPNQVITVGHATPACRFRGVEVFA